MDKYQTDEIFKKDAITWKEVYELIRKWIDYGDDPFYDAKSYMAECMRYETDERVKKNMEIAYNLMCMFEDLLGW